MEINQYYEFIFRDFEESRRNSEFSRIWRILIRELKISYYIRHKQWDKLTENLKMIQDFAIQLEMCSICREKNGNMLTNCGHSFCIECLMKWYIINMRNITCPYCRQNIEFERCRHNYLDRFETLIRSTHCEHFIYVRYRRS